MSKENKKKDYKEMWGVLKGYVKTSEKLYGRPISFGYEKILEKMERLEEGGTIY